MSQTGSESTLGVYVLIGLLVVVLFSAVAANAADRTVLDSDHATETMEDEEVYAQTTVAFQEQVVAEIEDSLDDSRAIPLDDSEIRSIATTAVTEEYIRAEMTDQIEQIYAYIDGDRETLRLVVDLTEPKSIALSETEQIERETIAESQPFLAPADVDEDQLVITPHLRAELPEEQEITDGGEPPVELDTAASVSGMIGLASLLIPLLAVLLVALLYHVNDRSLRDTANGTGAAFVAAGLLGAVINVAGSPVATSAAEGRLDIDSAEFTSLSDGVVALVDSFFATIMSYSLFVGAFGVGLLALVYADDNGYFEFIKDRLGSEQSPAAAGGRSGGAHSGQYDDDEAHGTYQQEQHRQPGASQTGAQYPEETSRDEQHQGADTYHQSSGEEQSRDDTESQQPDAQSGDAYPESGDQDDEQSGEAYQADRGHQDASDQYQRETAYDESAYQPEEQSQAEDPDQYDEHGFKRERDEETEE